MHGNQAHTTGEQTTFSEHRRFTQPRANEAESTKTRSISTRQMVLLAPSTAHVPVSFARLDVDPVRHRQLLETAQRLRARSYLHDGAIEPWQVSKDGRFKQEGDEQSWHLLVLDSTGKVGGCARYRPHRADVAFSTLSVSKSAIAKAQDWGPKLRGAIQADLQQARQRGIGYVECGGWALADDLRCSTEAVRMALSMYALARICGGVLGVTTATTRHHSSDILRRIGGQSLKVGPLDVPPYYDPQYACEMEILRFDSSAPQQRFESKVQTYELDLSQAPVVQSGTSELWARTLMNATEGSLRNRSSRLPS